ncbi:MAG: translation elongation factor Ts [Actinobacteria bacterium]|nr:translation elongation factor Ts [Actinomycetota bacterium]
MTYSAADVKRLREVTGAGMLDCKKALDESNGDFEGAVAALRIKGAKDVGKREGRDASNGLIVAIMEPTTAVMVELNCETDFVAKTEGFQSLADAIAQAVKASAPTDLDALLAASMSDGKAIKDALVEANSSMGEKIEVRRFAVFNGNPVDSYLHKSDPALPPTVGVVVETTTSNPQVTKDLAQHIAAMSPRYLTREEVPAEVVEAERRIAAETAKEEGKPEAALPKIIEGRVNGFFKDFVLLEQAFVKDNKKTIAAMLEAEGVTVKRFARFKVGQA